jgi:hypothetical protein
MPVTRNWVIVKEVDDDPRYPLRYWNRSTRCWNVREAYYVCGFDTHDEAKLALKKVRARNSKETRIYIKQKRIVK